MTDLSLRALFAAQSGQPYAVTHHFDSVDLLNGGKHRATDVGNFGANDPIKAASTRGRGLYHFDTALGYEDDLGDGYTLERWHLNTTWAAGLTMVPGRSDVGDWSTVPLGMVVGRTGNSGARLPNGSPMPAHTHIVLKLNGVPIDAEPYLLGAPLGEIGDPVYNPKDVLALYGQELITRAGARLREKQGTSYPLLVQWPAGVRLTAAARVVGESVNGSIEWFETKAELDGVVRVGYVHFSAVDLVQTPPQLGFTQAQVDAARAEGTSIGFSRAKTKASAAVEAIEP